MKYYISLILYCTIPFLGSSQSLSIDEKVDSLLNLMTLDEKIGQMTQVERSALGTVSDISLYKLGSLLSGGGSSPSPNTQQAWANMYDGYQSYALQTRLGIPLIYGIDAVHGHNNVYGAVITPHNIGLGCTWNAVLIEQLNQMVATEVAATGIDWTFAPCIAVPRDERWGRTYEGFGETAEIQKIMAEASVKGLQGSSLDQKETILACAKHYVGDGGTINGTDQGNTVLSEQLLRDIHMPGYIDAIEANVGSVMASYNSWNGQKLHGHDYLLTDVLKDELGFEGFVISDWAGVDQINEDYRVAVKRAINAGIDMVMVPDRYTHFISILKDLVQSGEVSQDRIDDAVRRILKQKFLLNLFEEPYTDNTLAASFGSDEHRALARQAVRESMVLLDAKNNILPLQKNDQRILVAGKLANNLGGQCGGWTISWQGAEGNITEGTSILGGIQHMVASSEVLYSQNGSHTGSVDVAVVVIGESPYAEGAGDRTSLNIEQEDINLVKGLKEEGIPVVCILVSGRPFNLWELLPYTDAIIAAWLPGTEGDGVADILFAEYQPSGKLTHSWPQTMAQIPINYGDANYQALYPYKHGLQELPSTANSEYLLAYAASTDSPGTHILLSLSDHISQIDYEDDDFEIKINNTPIPNSIKSIGISDFDERMLSIELNADLAQGDYLSLSYSGTGILSSGLLLDDITDLFIYNAVSGFGGNEEIPGKIQAESYFAMSGIQTEVCTDIGGGFNVGYIEPGDWMKYNIEVTQSGLYKLTGRIAGFVGGDLKLTFSDSIPTILSYTPTDGWQNWQNFATTVQLKQGNYIMKALAQTEGFNINYFDFELVDGISNNREAIADIKLYPNPVKNQLHIDFSNTTAGAIEIKLFNTSGICVQDLFSGRSNVGMNRYGFSIDPSLASGIYFIEIKDYSKRYFMKMVKE